MEVLIVKLRSSRYLLLLMATVLAISPDLCLADEPPKSTVIECPADGLLFRNLARVLPRWLVCAISDEDNPVGGDMPTVSASHSVSEATQSQGETPGELGDVQSGVGTSPSQSACGSEASRGDPTIASRL